MTSGRVEGVAVCGVTINRGKRVLDVSSQGSFGFTSRKDGVEVAGVDRGGDKGVGRLWGKRFGVWGGPRNPCPGKESPLPRKGVGG